MNRTHLKNSVLGIVLAAALVGVGGCEALLALFGLPGPGDSGNQSLTDLRISLDVKFLAVDEDFFERIGIDFDMEFPAENDAWAFGAASPFMSPMLATADDVGGEVGSKSIIPADTDVGNLLPLAVPVMGVPGDYVASFVSLRPNVVEALGLKTVDEVSDIPPGPQTGQTVTPALYSLLGTLLNDTQQQAISDDINADLNRDIISENMVYAFHGQRLITLIRNEPAEKKDIEPVFQTVMDATDPAANLVTSGPLLDVIPEVSADLKTIRLHIYPGTLGLVISPSMQRSVDGVSSFVEVPIISPSVVQSSVSVPDGGTILLGGYRMTQGGDAMNGVPVLSKLPYVNRLFKNTGPVKDEQSLLIMVTPRIVIEEEE